MNIDRRDVNPLAIAVAVVGLIAQIGTVVYWGGRFSARVDAVTAHAGEQDASIIWNRQMNIQHDRELGALTTKLDDIQIALAEANHKLDQREYHNGG